MSGPGSQDGFLAEARHAMATRFEIVLPGSDRVRLQALAEEALDEIDRLEAQLSMYRADSEVSGINAYAAQGPVQVEPRLFRLLSLALLISAATGGAFDPTIGPLLKAWGFVGGAGSLADAAQIESARALTGHEHVTLDEDAQSIRFEREGMRLDLGAIGKGYAIDRAIELLQEQGVENALLHGGTSTVYGLGAPPEGEGWKVALRDPRAPEGTALGHVTLRDRALSVSAPHGKSFRAGDRLYGHVLDPRTGQPTVGALLAAVSHPSATVTDAISTALLVLGPEGLPQLAQRFPDADLLVLADTPDGPVPHATGSGTWALELAPTL